jgi:hypothetical protein
LIEAVFVEWSDPRTLEEDAMDQITISANPFALMIDPEAIFAAIERSDRLARLKSTICHPLDKPRPEQPPVEVKAFDEQVEAILVEESSFGGEAIDG